MTKGRDLYMELAKVALDVLKNIRQKSISLTQHTLAEEFKKDKQFNIIVKDYLSVSDFKEVKVFLLHKISFFSKMINSPDLKALQQLIESDIHGENLKNVIISFISIIIEYFDRMVNIQGKLKVILEEIVQKINSASGKAADVLDENIKLLKKDISIDNGLLDKLGDVNNAVESEISADNLKNVILSKIEIISNEIEKKVVEKNVALTKIEKDKMIINKDISDYKEHEDELTQLKKELDKYKMESLTDFLTGLYNRKFMDKKIVEEIERGNRYNTSFAIIFIDIDDFKKINDNFGHIVGDFALKYLADLVKSGLRKIDYAFRYGGEEIVVMLPETDMENAKGVAFRILETVRNTLFKYKDNKISMTVSLGVDIFKKGDSAESVIERADKKMLTAKKTGKNRVVSD